MKKAKEEPLLNQATYDTLFQDKDVEIEKDNVKILNYIESFTLSDRPQYRLENAKLFYDQKTKAYTLKLPNDEYRFYRLSNFLIDEEYRNILETARRYRTCHTSILDMMIKNYHYEAVAGYIFIQGKRQLHTVAKTTFFNEEVYIDVTGNIIMPIPDYEKLFHFQKISTLTQDKYIEYSKKLAPYFDELSEKMILTVMDDLAKDASKNSFSKH